MSIDLGKTLIKKKQFSKALFVFEKILKNKPNDLRANFQMGKIFYELNELNKSILFFEKCNKIQPNTPNVLFNLALILQSTGKIEKAKGKYLELISINKKDIKSYYGLHSLDINNITPEFNDILHKLKNDESITNFEKGLINFIFSKLEWKKKKFDNEIKYLETSHKQCFEANLLINNQANFYYKNIISNYFNKINFKNNFISIPKFNDSKHIFIVGLPRSGSSLVETIITHNSKKIFSLGEFHGINTSILDQVGKIIYSKNFDYKNFKFEINKKLFQESLIEKFNILDKEIYLDKSLENFFNIEIILEFFPNSKIIHTYRNFEDSVIAIYKTMLPELSWSHKLEDIVEYISIYKKTIKYFKEKYPNKIIDIELSRLTEQQETEAKRILNFCEIQIKDNFLNFDKNEKLFNKTNSFLQVRNKIKKYEDKKYVPYYHLLKKF